MPSYKFEKDGIEYRFWYECRLAVSDYQLKMIREELTMKQHYEDEKNKHEDLMLAMELKARLLRIW